jgi:thiamine biosynthesis lipoprotein
MKRKNAAIETDLTLNRRSFLKLSGLLGLGLASTGIWSASAEAVKFNRKAFKVSKTRLAMGTFVSMTLIHSSRDKAEEAMGRAFREIDRLTRSMNRYDTATAVAQLNSDGFLKAAPPEVFEVIAGALDYYRLTQQAFDISVKPVVDLFRKKFAQGNNRPPGGIELRRAIDRVGSDMIELNGRSIRFKKPGMGITLDGIAKGYIVDCASEILTRHRIKNFLINAGGDIRAVGSRRDNTAWSVAVQDPKKEKQYPDVIRLTDAAIATSGNYEVYFDREKMFHHIVDPRTGLSPRLSASVSVTAHTAMDADALSTSVFVMKPTAANRFINSLPGCECLVVARDGRTFKSSGWQGGAI